MKIGVDLTGFNPAYSGGMTTFALGLTGGLIRSIAKPDQIVLFTTSKNRADLTKRFEAANLSIVEIDKHPIHRYMVALLGFIGFALNSFKLPYWYDRLFRSPWSAKIDDAADFLIVPTSIVRLPCGRAPIILCVHDIQQEYHPEYFVFRERAKRWGRYRLSCWVASAIQASSQFVKDCLLEKFTFVDSEKIFIVPEGVDLEAFNTAAPSDVPPAMGDIAPGSFLFYPAQLWPHKNHLVLIEALAAFRDRNGAEMPCLLTGQDFGMLKAVQAAIDRCGLSKTRYLGKVPFSQLLWLYGNCKAVLALGLHESSSLPLKEGAIFGRPLICSDIPPNRELARDLFVIPFSARSAADLSSKFDLVSSMDDGIYQKSLHNRVSVCRFNWETIAKQYIRAGQSLCKRRRELGNGAPPSLATKEAQ